VAMHTGILALVSFADLSAGMLMVHLFTVDSRWPDVLRGLRDRIAIGFRASIDTSGERV
jgi:hypothetical protein